MITITYYVLEGEPPRPGLDLAMWYLTFLHSFKDTFHVEPDAIGSPVSNHLDPKLSP